LIVLGPIAAVLLCAGCNTEAPPQKNVVRPAKIMTVLPTLQGWKRDFPAEIQAARRVDLAFNLAGTLKQLKVNEGEDVKAGQLIAKLDDRDLRNKLEADRARLNAAESAYKRAQQLYDNEVSTKADLEFKERQYKVEQAEINISEKAVADTALTAPFAGRIVKRLVDNFQEVNTKQPVVSLQDISSMEVVVNIPENIVAPVRKKGSVKGVVTLQAVPDKQFPLTLKEFASEADPQTRTYRLTLAMSAPEGIRILPGMSAAVSLEVAPLETGNDEIAVPIAAVGANEDGSRFVWKVDNAMKVKRTSVQVGRLKGDSAIIISGLKENDRVVTAGINDLSEGQEIRDMAGQKDAAQ
jgi:RND family efflux transporter MFP subunit